MVPLSYDIDVSSSTTTRASAVHESELTPQSLGEALRLLRNRARLRRDQLAAAAGVSAGAVSNYENDVSAPSAAALRRVSNSLAEHLGVDAAGLWAELGRILDSSSH